MGWYRSTENAADITSEGGHNSRIDSLEGIHELC